MIGFGDHYHRNLRLGLLRLLEEAPGYSANTSVLHSAAQGLGFHVSRDQVEGQVAWLDEQALVRVEDLGKVRVVRITGRGADIAKGLASHPGVQRPSPGV